MDFEKKESLFNELDETIQNLKSGEITTETALAICNLINTAIRLHELYHIYNGEKS